MAQLTPGELEEAEDARFQAETLIEVVDLLDGRIAEKLGIGTAEYRETLEGRATLVAKIEELGYEL